MDPGKRSLVVGLVLLLALCAILGLIVVFGVNPVGQRSIGDYILNAEPTEEEKFEKSITTSIEKNDELSVYAKNLLSGGPPPDGIAPIDDPKFVSSTDADLFLTPDDQVFIVTVGEEAKIYPQQILVWHEVANDQIGGENIAVTYSPLTGSAIAFKSDLGTSGMLINSNTVYYDRDTESLWPQLLGIAISGNRRGQKLESVPLDWANWSDAKVSYPQAEVLSRETGFDKSYGFDPYGSYSGESSYYQTGKPFFPLMNEDDRLPEKEVVMGYFKNFMPVAVQISLVPVTEEIAVDPEDLNFAVPESAIQVMWFAWSAFFPETELIQKNDEPAP